MRAMLSIATMGPWVLSTKLISLPFISHIPGLKML